MINFLQKLFLLGFFSVISNVYAQSSDISSSDFCKKKEIIVNGFSYHFEKNAPYSRKYGYNEKNYGLGFSCGLEKINDFNPEIEIGFARNSYRNTSIYGSYGLAYPITENLSVGAKFIVASGYEIMSKSGYQAGPMLYSRLYVTDRISINLSVLPATTGFMLLNFGYKF